MSKQPKIVKNFKKSIPKQSRSVETLFRNSLRSNLDLTALADSKASVLISVNGFILTVIITASGLYLNNASMRYPFIMIMITALASILFATMAIRPRDKVNFIKTEFLNEFYSLAYFQDMAESSPQEYVRDFKEVLNEQEDIHQHIIKHIHILGSEINVKYFWLKRAYFSFALGLTLSAGLMIFSVMS